MKITWKKWGSLLLALALVLSLAPPVQATPAREETVLSQGEKIPVALVVTATPDKLTYMEYTEELDVTGGQIKVYWNDGTSEVMDMTREMVTGFDNTKLGTQTLTVTYGQVSTTFQVEITIKPAQSITVTRLPDKLTYLTSYEELDVTGGEITVTYADGTPAKVIPMTREMVTGFDNTQLGPQTLTVTYAGAETTYEIELERAVLTLTQLPWKLTYIANYENLNASSGKLQIAYQDGTILEEIPMTPEMVTGFDNTRLGPQTLTVTYAGGKTTYEVEIVAATLTRISVSQLPEQTVYLWNVDSLNLEGAAIKLYFNNNTSSEIPITPDMVTGFDNTREGTQTLTVTYQGKTATFQVTVKKNNTTQFASGLGTKEWPYIILTKEHLNNVRLYPNSHFKMIEDIVFTDADFQVGGAYYGNGRGWQPIGSKSTPFAGTFDGNGHTITGMAINIETSGDVYAGLFGFVRNGTVINLGMVGTQIRSRRTGNHNKCYASSIAGYVDSSTISNCYNTGMVSSLTSSIFEDVYAYVGGIAGYVSGSTISNCYNSGAVSDPSFCYSYAGGIAGYVSGSTISNCYNVGSVLAYGGYAGIAGNVDDGSNIRSCYYLNQVADYGKEDATTCTLEEMKDSRTFAGFDFDSVWTMGQEDYPLPVLRQVAHQESPENYTEFSGGNGGLFNPYRITTIKQLNNVRNYLGACFRLENELTFTQGDFEQGGAYYNNGEGWQPIGIDGNPFFGVFDGNGYTLTGLKINMDASDVGIAGLFGCVNESTIANLGLVDSGIREKGGESSYLGGIAGKVSYSAISNCYNTGVVDSSPSYHSYAGGIAGRVFGSTISNCYNTGAVSASAASAYAGGLAGEISASTISNCYNASAVSASADSSYTGGIVGYISVSYISGSGSSAISGCYNTGALAAPDFACAGGITGCAEDNSTTLTNCYYLNTAEKGIGDGRGDTIACTLEEMTRQETFQGFNFETVWTMEGSPEYGYPELIGMTTVSPCKANEHTTILTGEKTPTCTEPGYTGDVYCTACGIRIEKGQVQEATGHSYEEPVFDWTEDGKSCTVVFTCERDESHVQKLEADITAEITTPAACGVAGETTYTASVTLESREYSDTLTLADIPALAHDPRLENVREASDTQDGYTGDLVCSHCGEVLKKGQTYERIYRVYNPGNGKHHYTADAAERDALVAGGWSYEGIAWNAPKEGKPIYRVYHPATGNHLYTMDGDERDFLAANGWNYEGILCYSAESDGVPLYRVFNPYVTLNPHHYTDSLEECEFLKSNGWIVEGISWYGLSK